MYHRWPLLSSVVHEGWEPISLVMADLPDLSVRKMRFFFSFSTSTSSSVLNWVFAKCHRWAKNWDVDLTLSHREAHLTKFFPPPFLYVFPVAAATPVWQRKESGGVCELTVCASFCLQGWGPWIRSHFCFPNGFLLMTAPVSRSWLSQ